MDGTVAFSRVDDTKPLLEAGTAFDASCSTVLGHWCTNLSVRVPQHGLVYGLGQIEGTSAKSGCPQDGRQAALPVVRNGQSLDLATSKFHVSLPFLTSSSGYALMLNLPGAGQMRVGEDGGSSWQLKAQRLMDVWVTTTTPAAASTGRLDDLYTRYAEATGRAPLLPEHATRFWQSRLRYRTSEEAEAVATRYGALNISLGLLVIDFFNQRRNGDFQMDRACYPNVTSLVERIRDASGAELMVSLWPDVLPDARAASTLAAAGCLMHGYVDPTPAHCRRLLWSTYVKPNYFDQGVRHFWLDETDFMKDTECGPADYCGRWWHNAWLRTFADGLASEGVAPLILTRGWWLGAQALGGVLWSSDIFSSWSELKVQVAEGIAAALSGVPWWTTDVGGFGCPTSPHNNSEPVMQELVQRWYQFGALSPVFRTHGCRAGASPLVPPEPPDSCQLGQGPHGSCGPNEIWSFGADVQRVLEKYVALRNHVIAPYVTTLARNVSTHGAVTMRSLSFEFPLDTDAVGVDDQFLLGPRYLVAPVVEPGASWRRLYLPKGAAWRDYWTRELSSGGQWLNVSAPIDVLPLFVRE